jgi:hypothetical protein
MAWEAIQGAWVTVCCSRSAGAENPPACGDGSDISVRGALGTYPRPRGASPLREATQGRGSFAAIPSPKITGHRAIVGNPAPGALLDYGSYVGGEYKGKLASVGGIGTYTVK